MKLKYISIKNISKRKEKIDVYDIKVKDNHNFYANDILVHNCHNFCTPRLREYIEYPFKYRLGLSATLERMDNAHYEIMELFNFNVFKYTPIEALRDGVLNPFNFTNIGVEMDPTDYEKYEILTQEFNLILQMGGGFKRMMNTNHPSKPQMLAKMNERKQFVLNYETKFDVVGQICSLHTEDKIIIFNEYNEQTNKVYWALLEAGLKSRIMHSGLSATKRDETLTDFKNDKFNILCASKVLDEGYNLPKIDTAIIMSGNSTAKQTIQRMGRVLRKKDKMSSLYQIYVRRTMEEEYANERANLFKNLSNEYTEIEY